jgi:hypothetical protein
MCQQIERCRAKNAFYTNSIKIFGVNWKEKRVSMNKKERRERGKQYDECSGKWEFGYS